MLGVEVEGQWNGMGWKEGKEGKNYVRRRDDGLGMG